MYLYKCVRSVRFRSLDASAPQRKYPWGEAESGFVSIAKAFDGINDKFDAIQARIAGSQAKVNDADKKAITDRIKMRTVSGGKQMQEIVLTR